MASHIVQWGVFYAWLFKAEDLVDMASFSPLVESAVFIFLGCVPLYLLRASLFERDVTAPLGFLASRTRSVTLRHILSCVRQPLHWAAKAAFVFFSVNLFAQAFPSSIAIALPRHFWFLDPNGDGILTAPEIELTAARYSIRFLGAALTSCMASFLLAVKRPPEEFKPKRSFKGMLQAYWTKLLEHRGLTVILDLAITASLLAFVALQWCGFLGLDAKTVLTFGGISGIAVGLAAQSLVGNFISGILILVMQPFRVGDWIETDDVQGHVRTISWSFTQVETEEGPKVFLPNASLVNAKTSNRTQGESRSIDTKVPILFPPGRFQDCHELLSGLEEHLASLDVFKKRMVGKPDAHFRILGSEICTGELMVEMDLDNEGLGKTDRLQSNLSIEVIRYVMSKGCTIPLLEAEPQQEETPAA